ncbi:MAG: hypothetical protein ACXVCY_12285 [Pseudobdellovibrionaceae bacterium]
MKKKLIGIIILYTSLGQASFEENSRRYMSYGELISSLTAIFSIDETTFSYISQDCKEVTANNKSDLGYNNSLTGEAIVSSPNSGYLRWISNCTGNYIASISTKSLDTLNLVSKTSQDYFKSAIRVANELNLYQLASIRYETLPPEIQDDFINHTFYLVFGPDEVFNQFGLADAKVFKAEIKAHLLKTSRSVLEALNIVMLNYLMRDEFLSY